ncbi:hypothetical protein GOV03_04320 [Candidatus Woesearchaeota archaeon]|nr:hypothetical protein [Candidatus Woesearchaeota archaeon]
MNKLYYKLATMAVAGAMAITPYLGCAHNPVKEVQPVVQEVVVQKEKEVQEREKTPLEKSTEFIGKVFDKYGKKFDGFRNGEYTFFITREHLDNDGIKDFILVISPQKENSEWWTYPAGFNALYIEDTSEKSGLGIVDKLSYYQDTGKMWELKTVTLDSFAKQIEEFKKALQDPNSEQEKSLELRNNVIETQINLDLANKLYSGAITGLEGLLKRTPRKK